MSRLALLAALVSLCACATTPRALSSALRAPPAHPPALDIDWEKASDEAVRVLSEYLRVDTTNPPGNETRGAEFLASILEKEGIPSRVIEFAPGRGSLIARLAGDGRDRPLCLLSHLDVVTSEPVRWPKETGPLSGAVDADGMLWGRGALDMKGLGALQLMTLVWLKRLALPLARDVVLLAVADEEVDHGGMKLLAEKHWPELHCGHVLNEGGIGIKDLLFPGQTVYAVSVAEKGVLWLRMIATGPSGHGSVPLPGRAPERLERALARLRAREPQPEIHPSIYALLREAGEARGGLAGWVLSAPALVRAFVLGDLLANPATRAAITNTCQVTGFAGQLAPNVVPGEVSATLDCRLLPGARPEDLIAELEALVADDAVRFEVLASEPANESPWEDPVFAALARSVLEGRPDVAVGPVLSPGITDSVYVRPLGARAYGFLPFEVTQEEAATMHGHGERVSVANVKRGLKALVTAVAEIVTR